MVQRPAVSARAGLPALLDLALDDLPALMYLGPDVEWRRTVLAMTGEPNFTVEQANRLLPELRRLLVQLQEEIGLTTAEAQRLGPLAGHNGGGGWASRILTAGQRAHEDFLLLQSMGILLRDLGTGLVDFPAQIEGEPAFLCWRLGEDAVGYWHPRDSGFSSRRPL